MAGSNSTTRGVPRRILQGDGPSVPVIGAGQIPTIQFSSGNARALQQFSRDLFAVSSQMEDTLDKQAEAEATTQGALSGASGDIQLQDYGTIRGRAYNKAAVETFAATLDTRSVQKLNELQNTYWNNPAKLQSEWDNWRTGVRQELSAVSPEQAVAFDNRTAIRGIPAVEQAKDTVYKLTRSEADAALIEQEASLRSEVKTLGADLFSENPDRSRASANAIQMLRNDFMRTYSAVDPTTGKPLYSPEEVAKAKKSFNDTVMSQATLSWFDEQQDKAGAYMKFIGGDFKFKVNASNDQVPVVMQNYGKRNLPLQADLKNKIQAAAAATGDGIGIVVQSGGQVTREEAAAGLGRRTGSTRHDHGGAGDIKLTRNGQVLDFNTNRDVYVQFAKNAAAAGLTGIGVDEAKGYIHAGGGPKAAWGYRGGANGNEYLPGDFRSAIDEGWRNPMDTAPKTSEFAVSETLSPSALNSLDAEMRARISFMNGQVDRQQQQQNKALVATQEKTSFDMTYRLFMAGQTDLATGQPIAPVTAAEIRAAQQRGSLKPSDGEALIKALNTERPETSDPTTYRTLLAQIYDGEDVYSQIINSGAKLSRQDAAELLGKNKSVVRDNLGEFSKDQQFYFDTLKARVGQSGLLDKFDQGKADRAAQAYDEYRRRVLDPENTDSPSVIADDIANRATMDVYQMDRSALGRMVQPRFSVQVPQQNRLDVKASAQRLQAARQANELTEQQYRIEQQRLIDWKRLQDQVDRQTTAPKGK
jgi:hypothetical protein